MNTVEQFWSREQFTKPSFSVEQEQNEQVQAEINFSN